MYISSIQKSNKKVSLLGEIDYIFWTMNGPCEIDSKCSFHLPESNLPVVFLNVRMPYMAIKKYIYVSI